MAGKANQIGMYIKNNLNQSVQIDIMGNAATNDPIINSHDQFVWDLSAETFSGATQVLLMTGPDIGGPFESTVRPLPALSISGVVAALNTMGFGTFLSSGSTITAYNSQVYLADIIIS